MDTVREDADQRMYQTLAETAVGADVELALRLRDLLDAAESRQVSELERLRKVSRRDSGPAMMRALGRDFICVGPARWVELLPAES